MKSKKFTGDWNELVLSEDKKNIIWDKIQRKFKTEQAHDIWDKLNHDISDIQQKRINKKIKHLLSFQSK